MFWVLQYRIQEAVDYDPSIGMKRHDFCYYVDDIEEIN
jgi:hypothetical protein